MFPNPLPRSLRFQILCHVHYVSKSSATFTTFPNPDRFQSNSQQWQQTYNQRKVKSFVANVFVVHFACARLEKLLTKLRCVCFLLAFVEAEAADLCIRVHIGNPSTQKFARISLVCKILIDPYTFHDPKLSCKLYCQFWRQQRKRWPVPALIDSTGGSVPHGPRKLHDERSSPFYLMRLKD